MRLQRTLLVTALDLVTLGAPVRAQVIIDITPRFGMFAPADYLTPNIFFPTDCTEDGALTAQESSTLLGASISTWITGRVGFELTTAYAKSPVKTPEPGICIVDSRTFASVAAITHNASAPRLASGPNGDAHVTFLNARALYMIPLSGSPLSLQIAAGAGLESRGGPGFAGLTGTTSASGLMSIGLGVGITPWATLHGNVEDNVSALRLAGGGIATPASTMQNDWLITAGLTFRVSGKSLPGPFWTRVPSP